MKKSPFGDDLDDDDIDDDLGDGPDDDFDGAIDEPQPTDKGKPRPEGSRTQARRDWLDRRKAKHAGASVGRVPLVEKESQREPRRAPVPTREEVIAEVQRISMGGLMPTMKQFDDAKPATWASAAAQILRLKLSWPGLAEEAGLKPRRAGEMVTEG